MPVAAFQGQPDDRFRWPWAGFPAPARPCKELADAAPADRARHGRDLGRFLRALHDIDPADVTADGALLPLDPEPAGGHARSGSSAPGSSSPAWTRPGCGGRRRG